MVRNNNSIRKKEEKNRTYNRDTECRITIKKTIDKKKKKMNLSHQQTNIGHHILITCV